MVKKIEIAIESKTDTLPYTALSEFQGNLKTLEKENFEKLKKQILEQGFSFIIHVWYSAKDDKNYILDGHQRLRTVKYLIEVEGYECPDLPVAFVKATSYKQAKRKLFGAASQYGSVDRQGLYELMTESNVGPGELAADFNFPEINIPSFNSEFFMDSVTGSDGGSKKEIKGSVEYSQEEFNKFDHKCPRCGFEFDNEKTK